MTRSEIIAIQSELGVKADGIWGPITAAAYAARMAHEAPHAPVVMPPVSKPWWQSRAVLGLLASVLAMIAGRFGWSIDDGQITEMLLRAVELGGLVLAAWGTVRRSAPIDPTLVARVGARDLRLPMRTHGAADSDPRGDFRDS